MKVILVETLGGIKDKYLFKVAPSGKPLPGRSEVRVNFRLSSVQESFSESKVIATPKDKRVSNSRT